MSQLKRKIPANLLKFSFPLFATAVIVVSLLLLTVTSNSIFNAGSAFGYGYDVPGGGGGVPPTTTSTTPIPTAPVETAPDEETGAVDVTSLVDDTGTFYQETTITTTDNKIEITIDQDVAGTLDGEPLEEITVVEMPADVLADRVEQLPEGTAVVGIPYDFGPTGAQFSEPITLTFKIDPASIPAGTTPTVVFWDSATSVWVELANVTYDPATGTVTATTTHFTPFAVIYEEVAPPTSTTTTPLPTSTTTVPPTSTTPVPQTTTTTTSAPTQTVIIITPTETGTPVDPIQTGTPGEKTGLGINWMVVGGILIVVVLLAVIIPIYLRNRRD